MKERFKLIPAVYLFLRRGDEVLLLRRFNTGYQDGTYSLISGHLDGDELATDAMIREASEEAGIHVKKENLRFVHLVHRLTRPEKGQERLDMFFECLEWDDEVSNMEPSKCDDIEWFPLANLPSKTLPLVRIVLKNIENGISYSEYMVEPE